MPYLTWLWRLMKSPTPAPALKIPSTGTMTFINPSEAPSLHIEVLPSNTVGVSARSLPFTNPRYPTTTVDSAIYISIWAPRSSGLQCITRESDEAFVDNTCYDCRFHCEEIELDGNYTTYYVDDDELGEVQVRGNFYVENPCPCYSDGLEDVEFPCAAGHDGPADHGDGTTIDGDYMNYGIILDSTSCHKLTDWAQQQAIIFDDAGAWVGDERRCINTYDQDPNHICWGNNTDPDNLLMIEQVFSTSLANEDLLSFDSHQDNADDCKDDADDEDYQENLELRPNIFPIKYESRPIALAVATSKIDTNAYVLMLASGCRVSEGCVSTPVYQYKDVAIDDDTVLDVWVSDVLPVGRRLMFLMYPNRDEGSICLGQISEDFNLTPCKSIKQQSSDVAVPANS